MKKNLPKIIPLIIFIAAILVVLIIYNSKNASLNIPDNIVFNTKEASVFGMQANLNDGLFKISDETGVAVWESDANWKVQDFLACDIDNDSEDEILLLTWKKGSFGKHLLLSSTVEKVGYGGSEYYKGQAYQNRNKHCGHNGLSRCSAYVLVIAFAFILRHHHGTAGGQGAESANQEGPQRIYHADRRN